MLQCMLHWLKGIYTIQTPYFMVLLKPTVSLWKVLLYSHFEATYSLVCLPSLDITMATQMKAGFLYSMEVLDPMPSIEHVT